ncbi:hypothetical protein M3J09_004719 [Ascochyta lentis]
MRFRLLEMYISPKISSTKLMSVNQPLVQGISTASDKPTRSTPVPSEVFPISRYRDQAFSYRQETSMNGHTKSFPTYTYLCQ